MPPYGYAYVREVYITYMWCKYFM